MFLIVLLLVVTAPSHRLFTWIFLSPECSHFVLERLLCAPRSLLCSSPLFFVNATAALRTCRARALGVYYMLYFLLWNAVSRSLCYMLHRVWRHAWALGLLGHAIVT